MNWRISKNVISDFKNWVSVRFYNRVFQFFHKKNSLKPFKLKKPVFIERGTGEALGAGWRLRAHVISRDVSDVTAVRAVAITVTAAASSSLLLQGKRGRFVMTAKKSRGAVIVF